VERSFRRNLLQGAIDKYCQFLQRGMEGSNKGLKRPGPGTDTYDSCRDSLPGPTMGAKN
jgi:hypothetical protein